MIGILDTAAAAPVTVAGDIPAGINGDTSVVRKGDASQYSPLAA